jgi:transcription elongation factor Elf1
MIRFACPSCNTALRAKDGDAGKFTRCPNCKARVSITMPDSQPAAAPPDTASQWDELEKQLADLDKSLADVGPLDSPASDPGIQVKSNASPQYSPSSSEISCPHCAGSIANNPKDAGRVVQCPHCNGSLQMPGTLINNPVPVVPVLVPGPALTFRCPHCHALQKTAMEFAGKTVNCPKCNLPFQIPIPQAEPVASAPVNTPIPVQHQPKEDLAFANDGPLIQSPYRRGNRGNGVTAL